jgi:[acyl-carrier-protein] S-malonyltransferase
VISNVTAQAITSAEDIRIDLANQITRSVCWAQSVTAMVGDGVTTFAEIGPGQVLAGLIKRISRDAETLSIGDLKSLQKQAPRLDRLAGVPARSADLGGVGVQ